LLWIEGFEGYATGAGSEILARLNRRYQYVSGTAYAYVQTGRTGGYSCNASSTAMLQTWHLTIADTLIVGCGLRPSGTQTVSFIKLYDWANLGIDVQWNGATGEISVYRYTTLLGATTGAGLMSGTWSYVEIKVKCHDTLGTVEVRVNGVTKLSLTNVDTKYGNETYHNRLSIGISNPAYIDDVYCCDNTGSVNNDFLGPRKVIGLFPDGDSAILEWTPSTSGTHYTLVDEVADATGDYVESDTSSQTDLWDYQAATEVGTINGIQINTTCVETNAESFTLVTPIKSGGIVYPDAGQAVGTTSIRQMSRVVETDPNTSALWTAGNLNAAQIGVKVA